MPLINLIQEQRLAKRRQERKARSFFLLFVGTLVASMGGFMAISFEKDRLESQEASLKANALRVAPLLAGIADNNRKRQQLIPRLKTLEDAQAMSERWSRILAHLSTQMPPQAWLTSVRCSAGDPSLPITIAVQGLATSQDPVGEFILRLQTCDDVENVSLRYTQEKLINQSKTTEFQVDAHLKGSAQAVNKQEEGKL